MSEPPTFLDSVKAAVADRLAHPVIGALIYSLVIWNWQSLAALFLGDEKIAERIQFAKDYASSWTLVWGPGLTALFYALSAPLLKSGARWWERTVEAFDFSREFQHRSERLRKEKDLLAQERVLRQQELAPLFEDSERLRGQLNAFNAELEQRKAALRSLIELQDPEWSQIVGQINSGGNTKGRRSVMRELKKKFKSIEELFGLLRANFGEEWDNS